MGQSSFHLQGARVGLVERRRISPSGSARWEVQFRPWNLCCILNVLADHSLDLDAAPMLAPLRSYFRTPLSFLLASLSECFSFILSSTLFTTLFSALLSFSIVLWFGPQAVIKSMLFRWRLGSGDDVVSSATSQKTHLWLELRSL